MGILFEIAMICAGLLLGVEVLDKWDGKNSFFTKIAGHLTPFQVGIGAICTIAGFIYLMRPYCAIHDIVGILAGLILLSGTLEKVPAIGIYLQKASTALVSFKAIIGIIALVIGTLSLFNISILC